MNIWPFSKIRRLEAERDLCFAKNEELHNEIMKLKARPPTISGPSFRAVAKDFSIEKNSR